MKLSTTYSFWLAAAAAVLLTLGGCSSDASDDAPGVREGVPTEVSFSISARRNAETRGDGTQESPTERSEKICNWFVVFVDNSSNTVRKILHRSDAEILVAQATAAVEEERFKCIIPSGTYTIYAFANIDETELTAATGLTFEKDKYAPSDISTKVWNGLNETDGRTKIESVSQLSMAYDANASTVSNDNLNLWNASEDTEDNGKPLPMTGILRDVKIENTIEETFSIEVVRMVAKVELLFENPGTTSVAINSVGFSPVTVTPVSLFPQYDILGVGAYSPLDGSEYARLKHDITGGVSVPAGIPETPGTESYAFYMKESISNVTGSFTVWLEVTYPNGVTEFLQFSPTQDIRGYINRNDWIRIPVRLSDYDVKVEALFYPPIGGYPAINEGKDPDGAQEFTFGTPGKFGIMPYVTDKMTGGQVAFEHYRIEVDEIRYSPKPENPNENWKRPNWQSASLIYSSDSEKTVATDKGIFTKMPVIVEESSTALPYEMLGELNENEGIAKVTLKVKVYEGNYVQGATPKHTYTRWLYIIRENKTTNNQD